MATEKVSWRHRQFKEIRLNKSIKDCFNNSPLFFHTGFKSRVNEASHKWYLRHLFSTGIQMAVEEAS